MSVLYTIPKNECSTATVDTAFRHYKNLKYTEGVYQITHRDLTVLRFG